MSNFQLRGLIAWASVGGHNVLRMSLLKLVTDHAPADAVEAAHRLAYLGLLREHANFSDRTLYVPGHATASAFVVARSPVPSMLLILHPKLQKWLQPGGHVEPGETDLRTSARRELAEETGIELPVDSFEFFDVDVHEIPARKDAPTHKHFDARFLAVVDAPPAPSIAIQDPCDARWFSGDELEALALDPGIHRMIAKCRARHLL